MADINAEIRRDFSNPPPRYRPRPLWFWNGEVDSAGIVRQIEEIHASGYSGFGILPDPPLPREFYLSDAYFAHYGLALAKAEELGLKATLYDEYHYPSGNVGERFCEVFPDDRAKRLDMNVVHGTGPQTLTVIAPQGRFLGAVAFDNLSGERLDVTHLARNDSIVFDAPAGIWSVYGFSSRPSYWNYVDYLDPGAVGNFIELTHERYRDEFPEHIGTTLDKAFYDEPTFYWVKGARIWTDDFNRTFEERHGYNPITLYPALWIDIGEETGAARNALLDHRAELYATGFPKVISDWCRQHDMESTGHLDQEEVINPSGISGDLMKAFEHQDIPGIDEVRYYGRASRAYKLVSSAANNYDKPLVMTEIYGAMGEDIGVQTLYRDLMDEYAKGINYIMPHAVWYRKDWIQSPPDLSAENETYGPALPAYNAYAARCSRILQHGRHVADIGLLYPIASLHAGYHFSRNPPRLGGVIPAEADYMKIGELLSLVLRRDFTYIHPEVLDARCEADGALLNLMNDINPEQYRVFILPGCTTIHWSNLQKIKRFYDQGGAVIATTRLPVKSAEFGKDAEVQETVRDMFNTYPFIAGFPDVSAISVLPPGEHHAAQATDENPTTWWSPRPYRDVSTWLEVDFGLPTTVDRVVIKEHEEHTTAHRVLFWTGSSWQACASGGAIGPRREYALDAIETSKMRLSLDRYDDVPEIVEFELYNDSGVNLTLVPARSNSNENGGVAYFAASPTAAILGAILEDVLAVPDVSIEEEIRAEDLSRSGNLSYIHKNIAGIDYYYFANSSDEHLVFHARLRGSFEPEIWDPHTGSISSPEFVLENRGGQPFCRVRLELPPVKSLFVVGAP